MVAGHTENACDRLFDVLKALYRLSNIYTYSQLIQKLNVSKYVTVHEAHEEDFSDWAKFLKEFYRNLEGEVKINHVFTASHDAGPSCARVCFSSTKESRSTCFQ